MYKLSRGHIILLLFLVRRIFNFRTSAEIFHVKYQAFILRSTLKYKMTSDKYWKVVESLRKSINLLYLNMHVS